MDTVEPWKFDPNIAVALMLKTGLNDSEAFERMISCYLLVIWSLFPGTKRSRKRNSNDRITKSLESENRLLASAASIIAANVFFSETKSEKWFSSEPLTRLPDVKKRLSNRWYAQFYDAYVVKLGGFRSLVDSVGIHALQEEIDARKRYLRVDLDIVRFILSASQINKGLVTRQNSKKAISKNIFEVDRDYYVAQGQSRSSPNRTDPRVVSEQTVDARWDDSPVSLVLLYAINEVCPHLLQLDIRNRNFLNEMMIACTDRKNSPIRALQYYAAIINEISEIDNGLQALKDWNVVSVPLGRAQFQFPKFTEDQLVKVLKIDQEPKSEKGSPENK